MEFQLYTILRLHINLLKRAKSKHKVKVLPILVSNLEHFA